MNKGYILKKIIPLIYVLFFSCVMVTLAIKWEKKEHFEKNLCINEVCEKSFSYYKLTGANCGYIELYNPTEEILSLEDYYITNDKQNKDTRAYLKGLSIAPKGYLLLTTTGMPYKEGGIHIPVLMEDGEETIYLLNTSGVVIDSVKLPQLEDNISYFRKADGSSYWDMGESTPGIDNKNSYYQASLKEPIFSLESGFYQDEKYLELSFADCEDEKLPDLEGKIGADVKIVYTTDGSLPTSDNGMEYTEPISLQKLSERKNIYANRTDTSVGYLEEVIKQAEQIVPGYTIPEDTLDKAVVIRAAVINRHSGSASKVVTKSYFMDYQQKKGYDDLAVVSLVTAPENLFDHDTGIYITGDFWERTGPNDQPWEFWYTNYNQTGPTWERPAQIEFFDVERELVWRQSLGIAVRGLSSRAYAQKGFRLHAREEMDGNKYITHTFFDEEDALETLQLTNGGNDTDTKIKDYLMSELIPDRAFSNPKMIPCAVFLNGEYWGMYYIAQNYDESYIHTYYGVDEDNVIIIKNGDVKEGTAEDLEDYHAFEEYVIHTDFSIQDNYQELCRKMDIQSYLDYYCTQIYISRKRDWPHTNFALWKSRTIGDSAYEDGRWRWMLFDVNTEEGELEEYLVEFDTIAEVDFHNEMFHALMQIPEVKKQFVITMMDLYNGYFKDEKVLPLIDNYEQKRKEAMLLNLDRFYGENKGEDTFEAGINSIRNFFFQRKEYMFSYMKTDLDLQGEVADISLQTNLPEAGNVEINTLNAEFDNGSWQGYYFTDYPIVLNATAKDGYAFVGWEGDVESTKTRIEVPLDYDGVEIRAVYQKVQAQ